MTDFSLSALRDAAYAIYRGAIADLEIGAVMQRKPRFHQHTLTVDQTTLDLRSFQRIFLIAVGKAAFPMMRAITAGLKREMLETQEMRGIAVGAGHPPLCRPGLTYLSGAHPYPDATSFAAAEQILALLLTAGSDTLVFFLISGGASAMLEQPVIPTLPVEEMISLHRILVHSGLSIADMNVLRKHVSAVKGGRLAVACKGATQCTLLISDVPSGMEGSISSGPSLPDPSTLADCQRLLQTHREPLSLPPALHAAFEGRLAETPKSSNAAFARSSHHLLLSSDDLCEAAKLQAERLGFATSIDLTCDEWDYRAAASHLLARSVALRHSERPICLISAGELAVALPARPGIGGRNQQFALHCAQQMAGSQSPYVVLSAGSDGMDGNSLAAGAVVDQTTANRAHAAGFSIAKALNNFDSFPLLHQIGDAIITGPSGNNVRDLRLFLQPAV